MRKITLVGYGNQGRAWAANLRDSGWNVVVSGRANGNGIAQARGDGFSTLAPSQLRTVRGPIALLLPDEAVPAFYAEYLAGDADADGDADSEGDGGGAVAGARQFLFAHGFAVTFTRPPVAPADDLILVAPKGIGPKLRENYVAGGGVMGVLAVAQDGSGQAWDCAQAVAEGLGLTRVGVLRSTFEHETKTDLLSEQVVLCGSVPRLVEDTVEFLVAKGIDPKLAEYECLNELKLIVDMMVEHGVQGMLKKVSRAAYYGGMEAADVVLPRPELRARTEKLWGEIENGGFARRLAARLATGEKDNRA